MVKNLIVQKYGGATLSDPVKIKNVAKRIASLSSTGKKLVIVVSAMGKTTNQLIDLAQNISPNPIRRELDMLLSTGERIAMSLLSIALNDLGCSAISFTGSQAGILTDESHVNAYIKEINAPRVTEALENNKIVVLAGFQGVSPRTKEITTLGRGGSDITAIAMAAYLGAESCEIMKDVDSVFSADPKIVSSAKSISQLNYQQLLDMTFWGAKFLHYRSVELASLYHVPLFIGSAEKLNSPGTKVKKMESEKMEKSKIQSINSHEQVLEIETELKSKSEVLEALDKLFNEKEIAFPQILQITQFEKVKILMTGPAENLDLIEKALKESKLFKLNPQKLSAVAANCSGATSVKTINLIAKTLEENQIFTQQILTNPMSIIAIVPQLRRVETIQTLHQLIE